MPTKAKKPAALILEDRDPYSLTPNPENTKLHTDKQIDAIVASMDDTGGSLQPILIDKHGMVWAGHGRLEAHKRRGDAMVPTVYRPGLTKRELRRFMVADNQLNAMTGNDADSLAQALHTLRDDNVDLSQLGFTDKELDKILGYDKEAEKDELGDAETVATGVVQLTETLVLPPEEYAAPLDLPKLREDMLFDPSDNYTPWMNRHRTTDEGHDFIHMFGRESTKGLDPSRTLIGFYIDDKRFSRIWTHRAENTQRFLSAKVKGLIMPDFTRVDGMPFAENLWSAYRNFYMARYWQEAGLRVLPNLTDWDIGSVEACCAPIPERPPAVAVQIQTIGGRALKSGQGVASGLDEKTWRECLNESLDIVKPERLLVYGGAPGLRLGESLCKKHGVRFVGVENRASAATSAYETGEV